MSAASPQDPGLTLRLEYADAAHLLDQWRRNLSQGRSFVRTREELAVGAALRLKVGFPALRQPLMLNGVVAGARVEEGEPGVDVSITFADDADRARLGALVERAATGDPALCARLVRLLVVEDNPHVGTLIAAGLREASRRDFKGNVVFEVESATDGAAALAALARRRFDAAISDVYLPVMDGPQFMREVRAAPGPRLPLLAVSAGGEESRARAVAAGCDLFLDKPLRLSELVAALRRLLAL